MRLSVVIVNWNTRDLTLGCIDAARAALLPELEPDRADVPPAAEIIVVDNGSTDGSARAFRDHAAGIRLLERAGNGGFAVGANAGLEIAQGETLLLLNSDVLLEREAVLDCLNVMNRRPRAGLLSPQLVSRDGHRQNSVHAFPSLARELVPTFLLETLRPGAFPSKRRPGSDPQVVEAVLGAALFIRREALERVGPLSEDYFFYLEETDWCWRMSQAGHEVILVPGAQLIHESGASSKRLDPARSRIEFARSLDVFLERHRGVVQARLVRTLRAGRALLGMLLAALPGLVSPSQRRRFESRRALWLWHLRGRPDDGGLAGWVGQVGSQERVGSEADPERSRKEQEIAPRCPAP